MKIGLYSNVKEKYFWPAPRPMTPPSHSSSLYPVLYCQLMQPLECPIILKGQSKCQILSQNANPVFKIELFFSKSLNSRLNEPLEYFSFYTSSITLVSSHSRAANTSTVELLSKRTLLEVSSWFNDDGHHKTLTIMSEPLLGATQRPCRHWDLNL